MIMRIGIDVDDTLVGTSESFDRVIKKYNVDFKKKYKEKWSEEEWDFICNNYLEEILMGAIIKEDAKEVTDYLSSLGHELIIITARSDKYCKVLEQRTLDFIKRENLKIDKVYFKQNKKSDLAKELKLNLMIDDNIEVYNNMKSEGIDCILFGDKIKTWKQVLEYIEKKEE